MEYNAWKCSTKLTFLLILVLLCSTLTESRSSGGSGGGGGGRGGGSSGARGSGGKAVGKPSSGKNVGKKVVAGGLLAAGGVAAYSAYKTNHNKGKTSELSRQAREDTHHRLGPPYFNTQPSTAYAHERDGFGMSAWTLLAIILGIIGLGALIWCCVTICIPLYQDKRNKRNRSLSFNHAKGIDDMPLQETPPTATPSP